MPAAIGGVQTSSMRSVPSRSRTDSYLKDQFHTNNEATRDKAKRRMPAAIGGAQALNSYSGSVRIVAVNANVFEFCPPSIEDPRKCKDKSETECLWILASFYRGSKKMQRQIRDRVSLDFDFFL
jgi:hypothetical protein